MKIARVCPLLALFLAATCSSFAQRDSSERILLGPAVGFDGSLQSARIPVFAFSSDCGEFTSGTAGTISFGALLSLPSLFSDRLGLAMMAGAYRLSGTFSSPPVDPTVIVEGMDLVRLEREYRQEHQFLGGRVDLFATFAPAERLELAAGISAGYVTSIAFQQTDNVVGPDDWAFPSGQRSRPMYDAPQFASAGFQLGPRIHLAYRLPLGSRLWLQPALTAHADLLSPVTMNAPVNEARWQRFGIGGGVAVLFDLTPPPMPPPVPDVPPRTPVLAASIELYGVDDEGETREVATISVNEELYRQNTPMLPVIYFDRNASSLAERYRPMTAAGADTFRLEQLAGLEILEMQHRVLDVVGWRLRNDTAAVIGLIGSASREESPAFARARAEAVGNYLEGVWGIDRSRITIESNGGHIQRSSEATEDGRVDNRRVEIISRTSGITAPIVTQQMIRDFNPPVISIHPTYEAEAGLKSWTVTISQEENIVTRYSHWESQAGEQPELIWSIIHDRIDSGLAPLVAELVVEDSTGNTVSVRTHLPLVLVKQLKVVDGDVDREGDQEQIAHTLVAFNYNSADLQPQHDRAIAAIAREVRDSARITIVGYTDRIGDERYNTSLSANRADRVAEALQKQLHGLAIDDVRINASGAGIETERFANDLPEGRALSRGVTIVIEQQIADKEAMR